MTLVLRYIARSDRGLVRSNNEDSFYAGPRLLALADGMGGHAAGEVASQLVIQSLRTLDDDEPGEDLLRALERAARTGNEAISRQVERSPELEGMGTTLTAILFSGSRIGLCHVGDSRGYLLRDEQITQITRDDTFVQTLVDEGRITAEQAHSHPQRSLIMRALTGTEVEPTLIMREARDGDRYLLCSDGLSDVVSEETISETLSSITDLKECADRLIELALRGGGPDNVTVVVADVVDGQYGETRPIVGGAAGIDEDAYTPDPATAAGRAAALRPPAAQPKRPTILSDDDEEEPAKSPLKRWLFIGAALLAIIALAVGIAVGISLVRSNYYVGEQDGDVVIFQGTPDGIPFLSLSSASQKVCVVNPDADNPRISFTDMDDENCTPLRLDDLQQAARGTVTSHGISSVPQDAAQTRASRLGFLPLCPAPEEQSPAPEPEGTPPGDDRAPQQAPPSPEAPSPEAPSPSPQAPGADPPQQVTPEPEPGQGPPTSEPAETTPAGAEGCRER